MDSSYKNLPGHTSHNKFEMLDVFMSVNLCSEP
jgi:hypothetical protein